MSSQFTCQIDQEQHLVHLASTSFEIANLDPDPVFQSCWKYIFSFLVGRQICICRILPSTSLTTRITES